jgi:hypothetical protein
MAEMIEQVFVIDGPPFIELYRIRSFADADGIFFASIDQLDLETGDWEESTLTQFQRDSAEIVPIVGDPEQQILEWFGFTLDDLATQDQLNEIEKGLPNAIN